ncbi:hypothetical protein SAMN05518672_104368 [Chitinophaga sp. CF118]|nr:hypothetical protein SAMN05518672_104368 [Chitinophaga sp. CF118]
MFVLRHSLSIFAYIHSMSKYKDVVVTLSKKHPETSEPVQAGHTYVIGALGSKKKWYEIDTAQLNNFKDEDLQKELYKLLHPQTHH